jgi:hypothetical protein
VATTQSLRKALRITGALAMTVTLHPGCTTTTHPNAVLHFHDGTHVECPHGLEFGYRTVCHTKRGTVTVPWSDIARYELR